MDHIRSSLKDNSHFILKSSFGSLTVVKEIWCIKYIKYVILGCLWEHEERMVRGNPLSLGGGTSHQFGATSASTSFLLQEISAFFFWTKNSWCPKRQQECLHNYPYIQPIAVFYRTNTSTQLKHERRNTSNGICLLKVVWLGVEEGKGKGYTLAFFLQKKYGGRHRGGPL